MNSNCSNLLNLSNLKKFANSQPSAKNFKSFSQSLEIFFLTVGQNNFGNKILFLTVGQNNFGNKIPFLTVGQNNFGNKIPFPFILEFQNCKNFIFLHSMKWNGIARFEVATSAVRQLSRLAGSRPKCAEFPLHFRYKPRNPFMQNHKFNFLLF